jgi:2'-5' RNA ligase
MKYNIALIPARPTFYKSYTQSAQRNFANRYSQYLLGKDSIPHITLCQFDDASEFDEKKGKNQDGLKKIQKKLETQFFDHVFHPTFIGVNFLRLSSQFGELFSSNLFSVELLVQREAKLVSLHENIASTVVECGFEPLNTLGHPYRPHLTLACLAVATAASIPSFPHELLGTPSFPFVVRLGVSDEYWQFAKVLTS